MVMDMKHNDDENEALEIIEARELGLTVMDEAAFLAAVG